MSEPPRQAGDAQVVGSRPKILFVDDEPDFEQLIRQKYRREMRQAELELVFAQDGASALAKLEADHSIGLVFSDINMPRMDGLTLLRQARASEPDLVFVIVSAYGDISNIRTAMNDGAFDFLTKPLDFGDLDATMNKSRARVADISQKRFLERETARLQERTQMVESTFGRYLDQAVVRRLLEHPDALRLGGERRELTLLFSDLRGFSTLSERHSPEEVVRTMNEYLSEMIEVITRHGGVVNEILGDAILAVFGAPLDQEDHARRAVACAVAMQGSMLAVNERNVAAGLPRLEMGIGINTGEAIVGNIGSNLRAKYGVVGKHINLAARVEASTVGGQVVISQYTLDACGRDFVQTSAPVPLIAKGFDRPIEVYDVLEVGAPYFLKTPPSTPPLSELSEALPGRLGLANKVSLGDSEREHSCLVDALSCEGARIDWQGEISAGQTIRLSISRRGEPVVSDVYGKVLASAGPERKLVVRFVALSAEAELRIRDLLGAQPAL